MACAEATPAALLASVKKAKSFKAVEQPDGRFGLATGGSQTSLCSRAEHEELEKVRA